MLQRVTDWSILRAMPEETQGPLTTANADRDDALKRLEELEQRVKGAKEALRWQGEFILQWKKDGLDTTAAERLLPNLYRRLSAVEKKWIALREELGIPLAEATKPRSATPTVTVQAVGMRVERSYTRSPRCKSASNANSHYQLTTACLLAAVLTSMRPAHPAASGSPDRQSPLPGLVPARITRAARCRLRLQTAPDRCFAPD